MKRLSNTTLTTRSEDGFTLVELLVAMVISLVVMAAVYSTYSSQQKSYIAQDQVAAMQQNLRAAMFVMSKDMRMAGFDPTQSGGFGITDAQADTITFTSDNGAGAGEKGNGTVDTGETITYSLNGTDLVRNAGSGNQVVAENIKAVGFAYSYDATGDDIADMSANDFIIWAVDSDGNGTLDHNLDDNDDGLINEGDDPDGDGAIEGSAVSSVPVADIKSVKVWLLARTDKTIRDYNDNNKYTVGNSIVTPEAGYMYRLLSEISRCRNL